MSFLLDTNVISELRKTSPDKELSWWISIQREDHLFLSAVSLGELKFGIENKRLKDPVQAAGWERWFRRLKRNFCGKILPFDE